MSEPISARRAAVISLVRMEKEGRFSNLELDSTIKKYKLEGAEKALYTKLLYGVLERQYTLDFILESVSSRKMSSLDADVRAILRSGAYQIHYLDKIPLFAVCNESVKLAVWQNDKAKGYINAVLRAVAKQDPQKLLDAYEKKADKPDFLSVRYSVSRGLCEMLCSQYGEKRADTILQSLCKEEKYICARTNTLKANSQSLAKALGGKVSEYVDGCVLLWGGIDLNAEEHFKNGEYFIQSEPSAFCASSVGAKSGDFVIDMCACPGGKTFSMAVNMGNVGHILACDLHRNKLSLIESGAKRLGISIIETLEHDGRDLIEEYKEKADRVLCDVPCSGFGSISKKPEIRYKNIQEIAKLPEIQYAILNTGAKYVKKGGVLVYSTCTVNKKENGDVTVRFMEEHPDFEVCRLKVPDGFDVCHDGAGVCILPCDACPDGFYIAVFMRKTYG